MAHKHRTGPVEPQTFPVKLSAGLKVNDINVGDLVVGEAQTGIIQAIPIQLIAWDTDLTTTRQDAAKLFLGVASGRSLASRATDLTDITLLVAQDGNYDFVTDGVAAIHVGDLLAPKKAAGNALTQTLVGTSTAAEAIAVCTEDALAGALVVRGRLLNTTIKRHNLA